MATSITWGTKVIYVPKADLTFISGVLYELDVDAFRLELKDLEDNEVGMPFPDTHVHNTEVVLSGVTYARTVEIVNGYTVEFEDGQYVVRCVGANHNLADVKVANQVSLIIGNAAGLIADVTDALLRKLLMNRLVTDPSTGKIFLLDDDDTTTILEAEIWEDAAGTVPFDGSSLKILRRDRMAPP